MGSIPGWERISFKPCGAATKIYEFNICVLFVCCSASKQEVEGQGKIQNLFWDILIFKMHIQHRLNKLDIQMLERVLN